MSRFLGVSAAATAAGLVALRRMTTRVCTAGKAASSAARGICVSSNFDSGNIRVLSASDPNNIQLAIRPEPFTQGTDKRNHFQWFYFRVSNAKGVKCRFRITNASESSYPEAWDGYRVAWTYDPSASSPDWRRVADTQYTAPDSKSADAKSARPELVWSFTPERDLVWFAYFAPYSYERHQTLVARCSASDTASVRSIGRSLDNRSIDLVTAGTGERKIWLIARQHPGEHMAEWWMQGFLNRIINNDAKDAAVAQLLKSATIYAVPNMNPDGAIMGHLRTNKCGANLNREWRSGVYKGYNAPTAERSPEVQCVLAEMRKTGVDLFLDVHGDEEIPDNFYAGAQGVSKWDQRMEDLFVLLSGLTIEASNNEFQVGRGYGKGGPAYLVENSPPGTALMAVASNAVCDEFNCAGATLEMPYKDTTTNPKPDVGWTPQRCEKLGNDMVTAVGNMVPFLRGPLGDTAQAKIEAIKKATSASGNAWYKEGNPQGGGGIH